MAYKYDSAKGKLQQTTPQEAYGLQGGTKGNQPTKLVWSQEPVDIKEANLRKIAQQRAVLERNSSALVHLKGPKDRFIWPVTLIYLGFATCLVGYKTYKIGFDPKFK